jgi:hypothetical protein
MRALHSWLIAGGLALGAGVSAAGPRPAVVELFTSEGCSSCPPAEAYLEELARRPDVLALSFHVDYWDGLGWSDRFGLRDAVTRQRAYATALHLGGYYTPQVVIDGQREFVGSDRGAITRALNDPRSGTAITLAVGDGRVSIDIADDPAGVASDVVVLTYRRSAVTAVGRGENAGRRLTEVNIVRSINTAGRWDGRRQRLLVPLESLPADATDLAVLVQTSGQSRITGSATVPVRSSAAQDRPADRAT